MFVLPLLGLGIKAGGGGVAMFYAASTGFYLVKVATVAKIAMGGGAAALLSLAPFLALA